MSRLLHFKLQQLKAFYRNASVSVLSSFPSVQNRMPARNLSSQIVNPSSEDSLVKRMKKKFSDSIADTSKIKLGACLAYENCVNFINWSPFNSYFKQPDTFNSWLLIIQLHVWMIITTTISEKNGRVFRIGLVDEMWNDIELRLNNLTEIKDSTKKSYLTELQDQFQASLVSYDEGILDNDKVLAASVWRTFFAFNKDLDPRHLEVLVFYIRKQVHHLSSLNYQEVIFHGAVSFLSLEDIIVDLDKA